MSLSTCGIQYRILAVLNAQEPLFIGWGAEWATAVICTDPVRLVNLSHQDGQLWDRIFRKFCRKSFLFKSRVRTVRHWRPDGCTSAASNFHIRLSASRPRGINVRTAILQHAISISAMRASGPMLTDVRMVEFELRFLPFLWVRPDGKPHRPEGVSIFPYSELGKNLKLIDHWWASGRAVERSGRMQAGTEASRYSVGSRRKDTSSRRMMLVCLASGWDDTSSGRMEQWTDGRPDGMTRRPADWQGTWISSNF